MPCASAGSSQSDCMRHACRKTRWGLATGMVLAVPQNRRAESSLYMYLYSRKQEGRAPHERAATRRDGGVCQWQLGCRTGPTRRQAFAAQASNKARGALSGRGVSLRAQRWRRRRYAPHARCVPADDSGVFGARLRQAAHFAPYVQPSQRQGRKRRHSTTSSNRQKWSVEQ